MLQEMEINKLVPNDYNPPNRAYRSIDSLSSSLRSDGQISTITVRPVDGGKYEIVDGTRRFESAKKSGLEKMLCNVLELSREEAMDYNYIANKETEPDSPMDEAWRFFERLGLQEGQLFQEPDPSERSKKGVGHLPVQLARGLPSKDDNHVQGLAGRLNIKPYRIESRLPLMALPPQLVAMLEKGEMAIGSAEQLARLRLLEDKAEAHDMMVKTWKKCGNSPSDLNVSVTATLEDYRRAKELAEQDLKPYEEQVKDRLKKLKNALSTVDTILAEFCDQLPEELQDDFKDKFSEFVNVDVSEEIDADWSWPSDLLRYADRVSAELTKEDRLAQRLMALQSRRNKLQVNREYIKDHGECEYCGTSIKLSQYDTSIEKVEGEINETQEKDDARSSSSHINQNLSKAIRNVWSDYSSAKKALDVARKKKEEAVKRGTTDG